MSRYVMVMAWQVICSRCQGMGEVYVGCSTTTIERCWHCKGTGVLEPRR